MWNSGLNSSRLRLCCLLAHALLVTTACADASDLDQIIGHKCAAAARNHSLLLDKLEIAHRQQGADIFYSPGDEERVATARYGTEAIAFPSAVIRRSFTSEELRDAFTSMLEDLKVSHFIDPCERMTVIFLPDNEQHHTEIRTRFRETGPELNQLYQFSTTENRNRFVAMLKQHSTIYRLAGLEQLVVWWRPNNDEEKKLLIREIERLTGEDLQ